MMKKRLAVFGMDGSRLDVVKKWVDIGYLPTIKKIIEKGVSGEIKSLLPGPHSFSAWTSFATGTNPGKHGLCYPVVPDFKNQKLQFINSTHIKNKKIWNYLSEDGKVVGIMDLPILYPVEPLNGIMVSSWGTPALESEYTYPGDIKHIMDNFEAGTIANCYERSNQALNNLYRATNQKFNSIKWFFNNYDWDFFANDFIEPELLHHLYSPYLDITHEQYNPNYETIIRDYYIKMDKFFAEILQMYPELNIIIMSDHGHCANKEYVYVNNILAKYDFFYKSKINVSQKNKVYHGIIKQLTNLYLQIPISVKKEFNKLIPKFFADKVKHKKTLDINWDKSIAFCLQLGMVYINRSYGDIQNGKISVEDTTHKVFEALKNDEIMKTKVRGLYLKKDLFNGQNQDTLPDIVIDFYDDYKINTGTPENIFSEKIKSNQPTSHTMDAMFLAYGPEFKEGLKIKGRSIMDIMPTIMHFFNLHIPKEVDGVIMKEIFKKFEDNKIKVKGREELILNQAIKGVRI